MSFLDIYQCNNILFSLKFFASILHFTSPSFPLFYICSGHRELIRCYSALPPRSNPLCHCNKVSRAMWTDMWGMISMSFQSLSFLPFQMHHKVMTKVRSCCWGNCSSSWKNKETKPSAVSRFSMMMCQRFAASLIACNASQPKKTCQSFSYDLSHITHQSLHWTPLVWRRYRVGSHPRATLHKKASSNFLLHASHYYLLMFPWCCD